MPPSVLGLLRAGLGASALLVAGCPGPFIPTPGSPPVPRYSTSSDVRVALGDRGPPSNAQRPARPVTGGASRDRSSRPAAPRATCPVLPDPTLPPMPPPAPNAPGAPSTPAAPQQNDDGWCPACGRG